jgi:hypothetical protein
MILGMSVSTFTMFHVVLSLIGILSGAIVVFMMWSGRDLPGLTALFLITTIATSATGFLFHSASFGPPHVLGIISLIVLLAAVLALYVYHLAGIWRSIYVVSAVLALYLNVFVAVVQAFQKVPQLHQFAPHGTEPAFVVAQSLVLVLFLVCGFFSVKRFRPVGIATA